MAAAPTEAQRTLSLGRDSRLDSFGPNHNRKRVAGTRYRVKILVIHCSIGAFSLRKSRAVVIATAFLALAALSLAVPSASARTTARHFWIVSLGDSYTAGNGAGNYYRSDDGCHRSYDSYPWRYMDILRSKGFGADIWHVACGAAVVRDITHSYKNEMGVPELAQLDEVPRRIRPQADIVLLTIGGNDLLFSDAVSWCIVGWMKASTCSKVLTTDSGLIGLVARQTENALVAAADRMRNAQIVLIGYPRLTSPGCSHSPFNSLINTLQGRFDSAQRGAVDDLNVRFGTHRFHYVPLAAVFAGHGPCAAKPVQFIRKIVLKGPRDHPKDPFSWESFHPNKAGHQVIANWLFHIGVQNWVTAPSPSPNPTPTKSTWPTKRNDGTPAFFEYLGASFIIPDWSSCSTNYCIAGSGDTVYVFSLPGGINQIGTVPLDTPDPRAALSSLGVPATDIDTLLQPTSPE
jgi:lysophospholipase L1-like esterase